jgi:hypothetical protein
MTLLRSGKPIGTIFDLLGKKEDDMTYALGFVASRSSRFAAGLAAAVGGPSDEPRHGTVRLQEVDSEGRTDVEIEWPQQFHAVFEAKRGPWLPTEEQLRKYVVRLAIRAARIQRLVTVTNAPTEYADATLPRTLDGIPVVHLTWARVRHIARAAKSGEANRNRALLHEFDVYLEEILGMENVRSNMVYVLSLGAGGVWGLDFKDVVNNRRCYFDPVARYRSGLPNYIAFRYDGRLQTIHHVEGASVFDDPHAMFDDARSSKEESHYLFRLGPAMAPPHEVRNGPKIQRSNRVWCMLDLLLTSATISDAWLETQKRLASAHGDREGEPQE